MRTPESDDLMKCGEDGLRWRAPGSGCFDPPAENCGNKARY
jgi:hypothetical protein